MYPARAKGDPIEADLILLGSNQVVHTCNALAEPEPESTMPLDMTSGTAVSAIPGTETASKSAANDGITEEEDDALKQDAYIVYDDLEDDEDGICPPVDTVKPTQLPAQSPAQ